MHTDTEAGFSLQVLRSTVYKQPSGVDCQIPFQIPMLSQASLHTVTKLGFCCQIGNYVDYTLTFMFTFSKLCLHLFLAHFHVIFLLWGYPLPGKLELNLRVLFTSTLLVLSEPN